MRTYQDLDALKENEQGRIAFIQKVVEEHKGSQAYKDAAAGEAYYAKRNITIEKFKKLLRDVNGIPHEDVFSANYKLKTGFFRRFVTQQVQYVLSNGIVFEEEKIKEQLGKAFEVRLQEMAKKAMVGGVSFGFWNRDHLEVFGFADTPVSPGFAPLCDEETGKLRAGVRYWELNDTQRMTLYEEDGYTEYIKPDKESKMKVLSTKQNYIKTTVKTQHGGVESESGRNYGALPIIPMYANDLRESELNCIRDSIDCYDFIKSGLANEIDDTTGFYWILKNSGGMDDDDLQKFLERMKVVRAATVDADQGQAAEAHTLDVPTAAREAMLTLLREDMYDDFMLLDTKKAVSGNITATGIRLSYQPQDDKCGDFEFCIREFVDQLLELIGAQGDYAFKWNRIANQTEETQMVMTAAQYLDDETVLKHLPFLLPEEVKEIMKRKEAENMKRYTPPTPKTPTEAEEV